MAEDESLTTYRRNSNSSDDTRSHISLRKGLKDIFETPKRFLESHRARLHENAEKSQFRANLVQTANEHTKRPSLQPLLVKDTSKRDLFESTDTSKNHGCHSSFGPTFYEEQHKAATNKWQEFDHVESETDADHKHGPPLTYTPEIQTGKTGQTFEKVKTRSASDRGKSDIASETKVSQPVHNQNADSKSKETFVNIGFSGVDSVPDVDADMQKARNDKQHTPIENRNNITPRQDYYPKKWFISLLVITIILLLALLLLFLEQRQDKYIRNEDLKHIVKEYLSSLVGQGRVSSYCLPCDNIDETISKHFMISGDGRCCVKDESQILEIFSGLTDMKTKEYTSRLDILDGSQTKMVSAIADLQMKVFDEHNISTGWPKHPEIKKNNRLINVLLTRRRSAIQLKGKVKNGVLKWSTDMSEGKLSHIENVINVANGGLYVMYSMVRFKKNACGSEGPFGYAIKHRSGSGTALPIASVYKDCYQATSNDLDLFIQKSFKFPVGQNSKIFLDIGNHGDRMVDEDSEHYFGVFEL